MEDILIILNEFGGGTGGAPGNVAVRFLLPTVFWSVLLLVGGREWFRKRNDRDLFICCAAILGGYRELLMFVAEFGSWRGHLSFLNIYPFYPPLEHAANLVAGLFIGYAFLSALPERRHVAGLFVGAAIMSTTVLYLVTALTWPPFLESHPGISFGSFWGDYAFRSAGSLFLGTMLVFFFRANFASDRVPRAAVAGIMFFFLDEALMLWSLATGEHYLELISPVRHNLHIWAIPLFLLAYRSEVNRQLTAEILQRDLAEQGVRQRERYLKGLAEMNRLLLTHAGFRQIYEGILRILGEISRASRVYLFENHNDGDRLLTSQRGEWCAQGVSSQIDNPHLQNMDFDRSALSRWLSLLERGEFITGNVESLPPEERELHESQQIRSILVLPIMVNSRLFGFLGFDQCDRERQWQEFEINLLQSAVLTLSQHIEQQQAMEEVAQQRLQLRTFLDNLPGYAFLKDTEGRYLLANRDFCRELGRPEGAIIGRTDDDLFPSEVAERYRSDDRAVLSTGREFAIEEVPGQEAEGRKVLSTRKVPLRDQYGMIVGIVGLCIDITDRKKAEQEIQSLNAELEERVQQRTEELQQANEELEAFCYTVSHDLRGPLTGIRGFSQLLLDELTDSMEDARDYTMRLLDITDRTLQLIDDLLALSRASRSELRRGTVDLTGMAQTIAAELQLESPDRRVTFHIQDDVSGYGDESLLRVVLTNLINNAWKYTSKKPAAEIRFCTLRLKGEMVYCVRDNGAGFKMSYVDRLFQAFCRLHTAHEFPGTGVGLATVRRIIQRHRGRVWAEGEEGNGASFYFTLPYSS